MLLLTFATAQNQLSNTHNIPWSSTQLLDCNISFAISTLYVEGKHARTKNQHFSGDIHHDVQVQSTHGLRHAGIIV